MNNEEIRWFSSYHQIPEGKGQILSLEEDGYAHLGTKPHPDSIIWCYVRDLWPKIRK